MFTVFPLDSVFLLIDMGVFLAGVLEGVIIESTIGISQHVYFGSPEDIHNSEISCENDCNT